MADTNLTPEALQLSTLIALITDLHRQHADDRCWMNTDVLFTAVGLPVPDRHVGDKFAMLANCARFIERQCEGGEWPTYVELEARLEAAEGVGVHLRHCNHGENVRACKYGELDCPALGDDWRWFGNMLMRAERLEEALRLTRTRDEHVNECTAPNCRTCFELQERMAGVRVDALGDSRNTDAA